MSGKYLSYTEHQRLDSGLDIPSHWVSTMLKRVVDQSRPITYGIVQAGPNVSDGIPYIRPADMTDEAGVKAYENLLRTSNEIAANYERSTIQHGDIVCSIGPSFGKLMITPKTLEGANLTQGTARIAISAEYSSRYFFWQLRSNESFQQWESSVGGATFRALNLGPLAETQIVVPSQREQEQIANFLDHETAKIDTLIDKQQQLIKLLKEKRQAVISHAVTKGLNPDVQMKDSGVEWLGEVPEHWVVSQFKFHTLEMQTGPFGSQLHADAYVENETPLINPAHIVDGQIVPSESCTVDNETQERLSRHKLKRGNLILARRGELGRCAVVKTEHVGWLCGTGSLKATLSKKMRPDYAYMLISSEGVKVELSLESKGSTMENLNTETLGKIRLPVPPATEQDAILEFVSSINAKYDELQNLAVKQIDLLRERRTALISAAVTGKIDVRNWKPEQTKSSMEATA